MIYLLSDTKNSLDDFLARRLKQAKIPCRVLRVGDWESIITLDGKRVYLDGHLLTKNTILFCSGFRPLYYTVPEALTDSDNTLFQDRQSAREQQLSHIFSMLAILESKKQVFVLNNPVHSFDSFCPLATLAEIRADGGKVPEFILTNKAEELIKSDIYRDNELLLWSYPVMNSPLKIIRKQKAGEIFSQKEALPYLFMEAKRGRALRMWFFRDKPLLAAWVDPPEYHSGREGLEHFEYILPNEAIDSFAKKINSFIDADFYEIRGVMDQDGVYWLQGYSTDPVISSLGESGLQFLADSLLRNILDLIGTEYPVSDLTVRKESRDTLYLTRMLQQFFDVLEMEQRGS